jgi:hypothetical protein
VGHVTWENVSIPQTAIPVSIGGHPYVVEVDEFAGRPIPSADLSATAGAGRIIDIADEAHPRVVSEFRLEVHQPQNRAQLSGDPGTNNPVAGYAGHYCAVPQRAEPGIVACSFILSGLRVFDIRDALHPKELAYFNAPPTQGVSNFGASDFAMSAPTFVPGRGEIWYADANSGFYALRATNGVWPFTSAAPAPAKATSVLAQQTTRAAPSTGAGRLPSTGGNAAWGGAGAALALAVLASRRVLRRTAA